MVHVREPLTANLVNTVIKGDAVTISNWVIIASINTSVDESELAFSTTLTAI